MEMVRFYLGISMWSYQLIVLRVKHFKVLANEVKSSSDIATYNQGIMEFAHYNAFRVPDCVRPLQLGCLSFARETIDLRPVKLKKLKIKKRYLNFLVAIDLHGRTGGTEERSWYMAGLVSVPIDRVRYYGRPCLYKR